MTANPENALQWVVVFAVTALTTILLAALAVRIAIGLSESNSKLECRAAGHVVLEVKDDDSWRCATIPPERAP